MASRFFFALDHDWSFHYKGQWREAQVPGCIHTDLRRHGLIPDPFYGRNEGALQWIEETDWSYRCDFDAPEPVLVADHQELVFEGLDTVAEVRLNGAPLLRSENMFHGHRVAVRGRLKPQGNRIEITFGSAMRYIRTRRTAFTPPMECNDPVGNSVRLRKQPCQFGWDWGPRFVTAGVWKPVRLEAWNTARVGDVRVEQRHRGKSCEIWLDVAVLGRKSAQARAVLELGGRALQAFERKADGRLQTVVRSPKLWWPAGLGEQPLYTIRMFLEADGEVVDEVTRAIGLRSVSLDQGRERSSGTNHFGLVINGRRIFCKGANWIPAHSFVAGLGRADYEPLLRSAVVANMNMIRLWGGGIYEHDAFYELCDELGLMVWHDFMFACTLYPGDKTFIDSVRREVDEQCARLHMHASIVLWCGNNEIALLNPEHLKKKAAWRKGYGDVFLKTIPHALRQWDAQTPYIHSSPACPVAGLKETDLPGVDAHDWTVWHSRAPVENYLMTRHVFVSEFGMQSYPSPGLTATFAEKKDWNIFSPVFENHQKNRSGNQIIFEYLSRRYRFPKDYEALAYLSQLNQAYAMEVAVDHFRRLAPVCLGALYWQLNDCWPVASWSSLEFDGYWKALHYQARRFFAPQRLSVVFDTPETLHIGNIYRRPLRRVEVWLASEVVGHSEAKVVARLRLIGGKVLSQWSVDVRCNGLQSRKVGIVEVAEAVTQHGLAALFVDLELKTGNGVERRVIPLAPSKWIELEHEALSWSVVLNGEAASIKIKAQSLALAVAIWSEERTLRPGDNYFDLAPGEMRQVRLEARTPEQLSRGLKSLRVYSLVDSYTS